MPQRDSKLVRTFLVLFFLVLIAYAIYEGWGMLFGPSILVPSQTVTVTEAYTLISGRAERITTLRLNGKSIPVTESGEFAEPYLLAPGSNYLVLEAEDARGRTTSETLTIYYDAPEGAPPSLPPPAGTTSPE